MTTQTIQFAFRREEELKMPIGSDVSLGKDVRILQPELVNLYGCSIAAETRIGAFVEIQKNATVGARCKISSHSFICEGVTIEDEVFIGHGVIFTHALSTTTARCKRQQTGLWYQPA